MSRPFALTLQAQALELHRVWLGSLAVVMVLIVGWGVWILGDRAVIYEHSDRVAVDARVRRRTVEDIRGSAHTVRRVRERRLTAEFPATAGERVQPGQTAIVQVGGARLSAVVTDVDVDAGGARAVLYAEVPEVDPFEHGAVVAVDVAVGTASPLGSVGSGLDDRGSRR